MGKCQTHLSQAARNKITISYLRDGGDKHNGWAACVAFYTALHFIEAIFDYKYPGLHSSDHSERYKKLRLFATGDKDFELIFKRYNILRMAADVARYLAQTRDDKGRSSKTSREFECFSQLIAPEEFDEKILNHCLKPIEDTVHSLMTQKI